MILNIVRISIRKKAAPNICKLYLELPYQLNVTFLKQIPFSSIATTIANTTRVVVIDVVAGNVEPWKTLYLAGQPPNQSNRWEISVD